MPHQQDIQKQSSLSAQKGRGMSMLFAEHLTEHILQLNLLVWRKCCNPLFQPTFVNRPNLIGDNLAVAPIYLATNWSSPCLCALRAAADQPFRTADLLTGTSGNTARRISRRAVSVFCIATSLSKIGLSSRSSSARKRNVVITKIYCFLLQRYSIFINNAFSLAFFLSKWETKGIFVIIGYVQ